MAEMKNSLQSKIDHISKNVTKSLITNIKKKYKILSFIVFILIIIIAIAFYIISRYVSDQVREQLHSWYNIIYTLALFILLLMYNIMVQS